MRAKYQSLMHEMSKGGDLYQKRSTNTSVPVGVKQNPTPAVAAHKHIIPQHTSAELTPASMCVCVRVCVCVRARAHVCVSSV
jgi:hypothetical protein